MSLYEFDAEWAAAAGVPATGFPPRPAPTDIYQIRESIQNATRGAMSLMPPREHIKRTKFTITSFDDAPIEITRFAAEEPDPRSPAPAVIYLHGGGFVANDVETFAPKIAQLAEVTGFAVFAVAYRLAPEFPAPHAVEDAFAAVRYIVTHAGDRDLGVDAARIGIVGESSGGALAVGAALLARDRGLEPTLAQVVLVYAALDHRTRLPDGHPQERLLTWTSASNALVWDAYVGGGEVSQYVSPAMAEDLSGLPPTYIEVGALDLLRDENMEMAGKLAKAGVAIEFHIWPGLPHGFDGVLRSKWTARAVEARGEAVRRGLS